MGFIGAIGMRVGQLLSHINGKKRCIRERGREGGGGTREKERKQREKRRKKSGKFLELGLSV